MLKIHEFNTFHLGKRIIPYFDNKYEIGTILILLHANISSTLKDI